MTLYYRLKFSEFSEDHIVFLQLNSSSILGKGSIEVIEKKKLYCLHIDIEQIKNFASFLDKYQKISLDVRQSIYKLYKDIHTLPIDNPIIIRDFIKSYHYSKSVIYRNFNDVIGRSPSVILRDRRQYQFIHHLLETDESITNSYTDFGYQSSNSLHKDFRRLFKTTPIKFRKKHRNP